jgi:hypothetical protein
VGYLSLREHTVPGILYFITLVTLLGEILNFLKNIPEPPGMVQFIFPHL